MPTDCTCEYAPHTSKRWSFVLVRFVLLVLFRGGGLLARLAVEHDEFRAHFCFVRGNLTWNLPVRAGEAFDGGLLPLSWSVDICGASILASLSIG